MNNKISDKDKKDWNDFLSNDENLPNKDEKISKKKIKQTRNFDLHGYSLDEANKKITDLIFNAYANEISRLIIVTGKGLHSQHKKNPYVSKDLGILKHSVPEFIKNNKELMKMINSIQDAEVRDGGSGAFYINLKKKL